MRSTVTDSKAMELVEIVKKPSDIQSLVGLIIRDFILAWDPIYRVQEEKITGLANNEGFRLWKLEEQFSIAMPKAELEELLSDEVRDIWAVAQELEQERLSKSAREHYELVAEEEEKKGVVYYYVDAKPEIMKADYYIFTPDWMTILRVPQSELGNGVLGVAYLGTNVIKILESLHGLDFIEVKKHEILHLQYPSQGEGWIRQRTKLELGFETKYQ